MKTGYEEPPLWRSELRDFVRELAILLTIVGVATLAISLITPAPKPPVLPEPAPEEEDASPPRPIMRHQSLSCVGSVCSIPRLRKEAPFICEI